MVAGFCVTVLLCPSFACAQKYSFTNYSIEDGLLQSQVTKILQDNTHHLVISTLLGVNRFDGKVFTPVTKDRVLTDSVYIAAIDRSGRIWCSNSKGLYYYYADKTTRFVGDHNDSSINATSLVADNLDNIWGLRKQRLFKITAGHMENINVTGGEDTISAITTNKNGNILAAVVNKGIFCLKNNKWINIVPLVLPKDTYIRQFIVENNDNLIYISTRTEVLSVMNNIVKKIKINFQSDGGNLTDGRNLISCIARDNLNGLWIGTNKGAYYFNNNSLKYFDASNGFTNNKVHDIFKDFDNNIWFGTNGTGIFRYNGDSFFLFDQARGVTEPILLLSNDRNNNVLMSGGGKLLISNGEKINQVKIPLLDTSNLFHWLYSDQNNNKWICTQKEIWEKTGSNFTRFYPRNKNDPQISFDMMLVDHSKTLWATASDGCYYWHNGFIKISGINFECTQAAEVGRDSILLGTRNGVYLVKNKSFDRNFRAGFLKGSDVMCLKYFRGRIYAATMANGLFIWNPQGGPVIKLDEKNGLSSSSVYSVDVDKNDVLWVGTGRGVNQFKIKKDGTLQKIINETVSNLVVECNQDAILFNNNKVWIGTTKGVLVFKNDLTSNTFTAPHTSIQSVLFYNEQPVNYTYKNGYKEPQDLKLPFDNSHITLNFNGIYLKNPRSVSYSYKLWPLDTRYCSPVNNNVVDYPSLPAGKYVFYVRSYTLTGASSNIASFSFEITPAYYQTAIFKVAIFILLFLIGVLIWKYLRVKEEHKRRLIAHLRLEEQVKIRKQTAEDFHDDLGNKLTRINALSEILYRKIDAGLSDQRKLIDQIKENADALFAGSKHILWALDPDNDRLSEVLIHIKEFGIDFFLNTSIAFTSDLTNGKFGGITLPMGYGRNITLIFKELFNNALRHSGANNVKVSAFLNDDNNIHIIVEDDGKGFDMDTVKNGHGMRNINNRAKKINGVIETKSSVNNGTSVTLIIKDIPQLH